jgi:hypothetical protein
VKLLAVIACIAFAALILMGQAPSPPPRNNPAFHAEAQVPRAAVDEAIRARQIILVDVNGNERASLLTDNSGQVFLVMTDKAGKARINLSVSNDGPTLTFLDPSGQARTILGSTTVVPSHVNDNGIAEVVPPSSIVLFDSKGKLLFRTP